MQSKTLSSKGRLFNATLFRKNLSRFWPLWGMASFLGSLLPLAMLVQILRSHPAVAPLEATGMYYSALTTAVPVVSLLYAVLCAMTVWSYLFNARSAGLMHTLPIRREGLFFTSFLSGMAMMLIPYAVTGGLCVLITSFNGGLEPVGLLNTVLGVLGLSLFYFATATAAAFVTGNLLALPVLYFLLHFLAVLLDMLLSDLAAGFLFGLTGGPSGLVNCLSPTVYLLEKLGVDYNYATVAMSDKPWGAERVLESVSLVNFWVVGVYALAGLVLLALAWLLYRRRQSERAGDVVAVGWLRPVFRYGVAALSALMGGRALYELFWSIFQSGDSMDALPMALCMAVAGIIGYYAAAMLLAKSLRVFRGSWLGPVVVTAAAALVCFSLQADLLGVADRVPDAGQIQEVRLYAAQNNYTLRPGEDGEVLEQVRQLHAAIAADRDYIRESVENWRYEVAAHGDAYSYAQTVELTYRLTGGVTVHRWYQVPVTRDRMAQPGTYDQLLDALVNSEAMKAKRLHLGDDRFQVESAFVRSQGNGYFDLNSREAQGLLDAVGRDAAAGAWGDYDWFSDDRDAYAADVSVDFRANGDQPDRWSYDHISIVLRPEMTETLRYLLDLGALTEADLVTNQELHPDWYGTDWDDGEALAETVSGVVLTNEAVG